MSQKRIRRKFDKEFKQEAVKIVQERNESVDTIAKEPGIIPENLRRWVIETEIKGNNAFPGNGKQIETELQKLQKELQDVKEEREILKKALAIFSRIQR